MNCAVLAHVQRRQMKTEHFDGTAQTGEPSARQMYRAMPEQRIDQHIQISNEFPRRHIRLHILAYRRRVRDFVAESSGGSGQA